MTHRIKYYEGTIGPAGLNAAAELEELGVEICGYGVEDEFVVRVSNEAIVRLDPLWGKYVWQLIPVLEEET